VDESDHLWDMGGGGGGPPPPPPPTPPTTTHPLLTSLKSWVTKAGGWECVHHTPSLTSPERSVP